MKLFQAKKQTKASDLKVIGALVVFAASALVMVGALNGGVAPTPGVWDVITNWFHDLLVSTFGVMLGFIALVAAVWRAAHGGGYASLGTVLAVVALAFMGPQMVVTVATATPDAQAVALIAPAAAAQR